MAIVSRTTLKNYFITGAQPTQQQFADMIDSMLSLDDDPDANWLIKDTVTDATAQKPSGYTLADAGMTGKIPRSVLFINNLPVQWKAAGGTYDATAGFTFPFRLNDGDTVTIQF